MKIDITKLIINALNSIILDDDILIPQEFLNGTLIQKLECIKFNGKIYYNEDYVLELNGHITGKMILRDDITLEPIEYNFNAEVIENIENDTNILDISDILWQNILMEVPSKVRKSFEDIELSGNGWRLISEEKFYKEKNKIDNPFTDLDKILEKKEEK